MQVSRSRVLLGGLLAGMVIDSIQFLADSFIFPGRWVEALKLLNDFLARHQQATPPYAVSLKMIMLLLQAAGLAAGILAVRFAARRASRSTGLLAIPASAAWVLTYGVICVGLIALFRLTPPIAARGLMQIVIFCLSGWISCMVGVHFGCWVYRESEAASASAV